MSGDPEKQTLVVRDHANRTTGWSRPPPRPSSASRCLLVVFALIVLILPRFDRHKYGDTTIVKQLPESFRRRCDDLLVPPEGTYTSRISRLAASLDPDTLWVAEPGTSAEYFLGGFSTRDWWLSERPLLTAISSSGQVTILTAKFEQSRAEMVQLPEEVMDRTTFVPWLESESPYHILSDYVNHTESSKRMVLDGQVRTFIASGLKEMGWAEAGREEVERVTELRERKDEREIGLLRCANQMTLHAIRRTKAKMRLGISESRTHEILLEEMGKIGLQGSDGLVLFGENAALPHGEGSSRRLKKEDLILIDAGGRWGGYIADVTRVRHLVSHVFCAQLTVQTFALTSSKIPPSHVEVWETVRRAQASAYSALLQSAQPHFAKLDAAARHVITAFKNGNVTVKDGNPDYSVFTTRLGHGIGLDGHESPFVNQGPQGQREVKSGHVFSLEPGIYITADMSVRGLCGVGVRLEDCFVVAEKDGKLDGEWLTGPVQHWGDL